jgi:hypothetical protein
MPDGPAQSVQPGESFESFRTWELIHDSWDRKCKGLEHRRMMKAEANACCPDPSFSGSGLPHHSKL